MTPLALQLAVEEDKVAPGLLGFTVVAVLAAATWLLLRSMTKQLKRVDFEEKDTRPERSRPAPAADETQADDDTQGDPAEAAAGDAPDDAAANAGRRETQGNGAK